MTRIAFVSTLEGDAWGGSEELWSRAAAALAGSGHNIFVNAVQHPHPARQLLDLAKKGSDVHWRRTVGIGAQLRRKLAPKAEFAWLDRCKPDLVVINQGNQMTGLPWMTACIEKNIRYAAIVQAATEWIWPADAVIDELIRGYEKALGAFFVSQGNIDLVRSQLAAPMGNAGVVRNPFNVAYDACPAWPDPSLMWSLATVGRLEPAAKGQDLLLKVLSSEKWRARPLSVTLYGSGANQRSLRRLAGMYDLKNVEFGGFIEDIEQVWARHHGLVLPSRYEGLPLAEVEAMLCGRICIVTDVAGNAELIDDNATGFVASAATAPMLDEALERAWIQRNNWKDMGAAAGAKVRNMIDFDPVERFARQLLALAS